MAELYPRILAELSELERSGVHDQRQRLDDESYLTLFLNKVDGRSYVLLRAAENNLDAMGLGSAELWTYEDAEHARIAYEQMLAEAHKLGAAQGLAS